jgi:hypothetical protein
VAGSGCVAEGAKLLWYNVRFLHRGELLFVNSTYHLNNFPLESEICQIHRWILFFHMLIVPAEFQVD